MSQEERDLLIRIDTNLINLVREFKGHVLLDDERYKEIKNDDGFQNRVIWMGFGALAVLQIVIHLIIK